MGNNKYNNQLQTLYQRSSFLPVLCRLSIKDVSLSSQQRHHSSSITDEPSSPKVSCMGQVKKRNSRVTGLPTSIPLPYRLSNSSSSATSSATSTPSKNTTTTTIHHQINYTKLVGLFSSKSLITAAASASPKPSGGRSCSTREMIKRSLAGKHAPNNGFSRNAVVKVNISELDPPLPVVKKEQQPDGGRDEVNLWRRRFGGAALKSLQIEQIHPPNNICVPPTTV